MPAHHLASPQELHSAAFDLLVLPDTPVFPASARGNVVRFLQTGGSLVALGGYPFSRLLLPLDGTWVPAREAHARQVEAAMASSRSLLTNSGFEDGRLGDGWNAAPSCNVVRENPHEGNWCVRVKIPGQSEGEAGMRAQIPVTAGRRYAAAAAMRTEGVQPGRGTGYAFVAVYQYDGQDKLVTFRDFATQTGDAPWRNHRYVFAAEPGVVRVQLKAGIYNATGTAWFDDIRLVPYDVPDLQPLNTASGIPKDGLVTRPDQIGLCDPSFPFRRTVGLRTVADGQDVLAEPIEGWPATAVIGTNDARWTPLLEGHDRYGRPTGAVLSLVRHYQGLYRGSAWLACGVTNRDLFATADAPCARVLGQAVTQLLQRSFLHELRASPRYVAPGETVRLSVQVANYGPAARSGTVRFLVDGQVVRTKSVEVAAYADAAVAAELAPTARGLVRAAAEWLIEGGALDRMETGMVVAVGMPEAPAARFRNNAFTLAGRPLFLFGTDTYAYTYFSAHESPLTWSRDQVLARDFGLNLYENLQFSRGPGYELSDEDWRDLRAMAWLTQRNRLVFMPGVLVGQDVAADDDTLARQSRLCEQYAEHLADVPSAHLYLNGDYKNWAWKGGKQVEELWNRWLRATYGDLARLRTAWGTFAPAGLVWPVPYPRQMSREWENPVAVSRLRFHNWLVRRWNRAHAEAIRRHDPIHPLMSEYYRSPVDGIDLPLTVDDLDVADIGYFGPPESDLETLPLAIRWSDQRLRGKGICLGEYGVKTHPAWQRERGGTGYHVARTESAQAQLAVAVAHYSLGMGAAKVQNWCLRDAQTRVFPWGMFYPNEPVPKPWAYAHRNLSLVWRFFSPLPETPRMAVCVPVAMRLGNRDRVGFEAAERTFSSLLNLHADFATIQDSQLNGLPDTVRTLVYPAAMAAADADVAALQAWVRRGGNLLVTGSLAYDEYRRPAGRDRLRGLCGVAVADVGYPGVERQNGGAVKVASTADVLAGQVLRPAVSVSLAGATALAEGEDRQPLVTEFGLGKGRVIWCADALSLSTGTDGLREQLYGWFLERAGERPLQAVRLEATAPVHLLRRSLREGSLQISFATRANSQRATIEFADGDGAAAMEPGWPALVARHGRRIVALGGVGELRAMGRPLLVTDRHLLALSLDGQSLGDSTAWVLAPLQGAGEVVFSRDMSPCVAVFGEFEDGQWVERERVELEPRSGKLSLDEDRATCVALLCLPEEIPRWTRLLGEAMAHPEAIPGY
jgi:hypothetical protein